jgi:hypothetical protein
MSASAAPGLAAVTAELAKVQRGAQTLGMVVERLSRDLYAMWIDVSRGDLEAVRERVLNAIPDCDDNEPQDQWNGTETGSEWLRRTREPFARGGIVSSPPGGDAVPLVLRNGGCMP